MIGSGDYLVPTFRGEVRAQKPILSYWLMSLSLRTLGTSELAARFWSPVAAALAGFFTYLAGKALLSAAAGLRAMVVLATTPLMVLEGTAATADALLLAGVAGAFAVCARSLSGGLTTRRAAALAGCLAVAQLAKGPVGLIFPLLGIAATWLAARRRISRRELVWTATAAAVSLFVFLAWLIPADAAASGAFRRESIGLLRRASEPIEGHGGGGLGPFYYLAVLLLGFAPWTVFLPAAASAVVGGRLGGASGRALLFGWSLPVILLMTAAATKLPHYILPAWPALAVAIGGTLDAEEARGLSERDFRWLRRGVWLLAPTLVIGLAMLAAAAWLLPPSLRPSGILLGLGLVGLAAAAIPLLASGRYSFAAVALAAGFCAIQLACAPVVLRALERYKPVPALASAVRARIPRGTPVSTLAFDEPSLDFYLAPSPVRNLATKDALRRWVDTRGPAVLVAPRSVAEALSAAGRGRIERIAFASGFQYSKGQRVDLVALGRDLPHSRPRR